MTGLGFMHRCDEMCLDNFHVHRPGQIALFLNQYRNHDSVCVQQPKEFL